MESVRRARRSWFLIPYIFVAVFTTSEMTRGQPLWFEALVAAIALGLYIVAWVLADALRQKSGEYEEPKIL